MEDGDDDTPVTVDEEKGESSGALKDEDLLVSKDEEDKELSQDGASAMVSRDISEDTSPHEEEIRENQAASRENERESSDLGNDPLEESSEYMDDDLHESVEEETVCIPEDEREEADSVGEEESSISKEDNFQTCSDGQEGFETSSGEQEHLQSSMEIAEHMQSSMEEEEEREKQIPTHPEKEQISEDSEDDGPVPVESENKQNFQDENYDDYYTQEEKESTLEENTNYSSHLESRKDDEATKEERESEIDLDEPSSPPISSEEKSSEICKDEGDFMSDNNAVSPAPSGHNSSPPASPQYCETKDESPPVSPQNSEAGDTRSPLSTQNLETKEESPPVSPKKSEFREGSSPASPQNLEIKDTSPPVSPQNSDNEEVCSPASPQHSEIKEISPPASPQSSDVKDISPPASPQSSDVKDISPPASPQSSDVKEMSSPPSPQHLETKEMSDTEMKDEDLTKLVNLSPISSTELDMDEEDTIQKEDEVLRANEQYEHETCERREENERTTHSDTQEKPLEDTEESENRFIQKESLSHSEDLDIEVGNKVEKEETTCEQFPSPSREGEETEEEKRKQVASSEDEVELSSPMEESAPLSPTKESPDPVTSSTNNAHQKKICEPVESSEQDSTKKVNGEVEMEKDDVLHETIPEVKISSPGKDRYRLKRKLPTNLQDTSAENTPSESIRGNVQFKGYKKRYIAQVSEAMAEEPHEAVNYNQPEQNLEGNSSPATHLIMEPPQILVTHQPLPDGTQSNTPLTEYAQYLGLQPTVKFKCYKCGESGFPSMLRLQEHQNTCLKNVRIQACHKPPPSPYVESAPSTNFRITRKVYLCSACGTYYENWNLFLHMREVHKRHICLFCLGMFSQADKLAVHLSGKHGVSDSSYNSPEHFMNEFRGSFFVMCCTCEQMFTERDHFFDHVCGTTGPLNADKACSLCGLKGAHFPTCRRAFTDSNSLVSSTGSQSTNTTNANTENTQNSQLNVQEKTLAVTKYIVPGEKPGPGRKGHRTLGQNPEHAGKNQKAVDAEDTYDISDAASYCHVNILEPDKQKASNKVPLKHKENENQGMDSEKSPLHFAGKQKSDNEKRVVEDVEMHNLTSQAEKDSSQEEQEQTRQAETTTSAIGSGISQAGGATQADREKSNSMEVVERSPPHATLSPKLSPKQDGESDSESSDSGADTHDSDGSSSSSEGSSEEEEKPQQPQGFEKSAMSDDSDGEKSDSDKMSIVVDETRSEDEAEKPANTSENHGVNNSRNEIQDLGESKVVSPRSESDHQGPEEKPAVNNSEQVEEPSDNIQVAGDDVPLLELTLEETLEVLSIQTVVKECVKVSCGSCVYCNHAKKIAVNGKQLVLHLLAEHRFEPIVCSDSGELTPVYGFVDKLKSKLPELQDTFFNTDTYDSADKSFTKPYDRTYECFHCHFITTLHKELYVHNRKMHQKTILLCIMCKSNFYSYSELLCHLCPGIYVSDSNILFRCCLCVVDGLPSAFRLMVHLRKRHHACDVCLETTGDQQKLSNHVWKHKLHHLCYRCGIAYRNKPDITKHLFWKHGTESVLCKKCLQKKWPHVYHFCIPPTAFLCEECNATFSRAVALKVHKRLHGGDTPYDCEECDEKFISKRLLRRHQEKHRQVLNATEEENLEDKEDEIKTEVEQQDEENEEYMNFEPKPEPTSNTETENLHESTGKDDAETPTLEGDPAKVTDVSAEATVDLPKLPETSKTSDINNKNEKKPKVLDVYDLPPLNLSSESDDSDEESTSKPTVSNSQPPEPDVSLPTAQNESAAEVEKANEGETQNEEEAQPVQIVDGVWDNFKTYKANLEKRESLQAQVSGTVIPGTSSSMPSCSTEADTTLNAIMQDHDYCAKSQEENNLQQADSSGVVQPSENTPKTEPLDPDPDHTYCFNSPPNPEEEKKEVPAEPLAPTPVLPTPLSPPLPNPSTPPVSTPTKKKQKSPKKKQQKHSGSSSSSDSSSNSDSSSCTCGTNCSCSSSSSSSSGSSSSSSDSDSSSSEGRRRQAARRERRKERARKKLEMTSKGESPPPLAATAAASEVGQLAPAASQAAEQADLHSTGPLSVDDAPTVPQESEETELLIHESDLDTTETETDEDFYDKYPQKQANKLLAEKRNQLLLLAAVAPVNNGTMAQPSPAPVPETPQPVQKKKGKTKRHKKTQHNSSEKRSEVTLKLNIPAVYYNNPSYSNTPSAPSPVITPPVSLPPHVSRVSHDTFPPVNPEAASTPAYQSTGSGSETESKRLSKRKRIPKRFYGDSSDEEADHTPHQPYKWRKVTPSSNNTAVVQMPATPTTFTYRTSNVAAPPPEPVRIQPLPQQDKTDEEDGADDSDSDHEVKRSSSDSSNSDSDNEQSDVDSDIETVPPVTHAMSSISGNATQQKNENLYCYCQCPYDEVSEMIACDGKDCSIEWFHFECVGIMVPPKGKWFCPDCRKKTAVRSEYLLHA